MSNRINWLLLTVAFCCLSSGALWSQDGVKEAQALLEKKQWAKAQAAFEALLDKDVDTFEVRLGMAKACYWNGDPGTGGFHASRAASMEPKNAEANEYMGRCFLAEGHKKRQSGGDPTGLYEQALEALNKALETNSKSRDLWLEKGSCCYWTGNNKEAAVAYGNAFKLDKKLGANAYWSAYFYHQTGQLPQAADMYTAALSAGLNDDLRNKSAGGLYNCFAGNQQWDALLERLNTWSKAQPKSDLAVWWTGYVQMAKSDFSGALVTWKKLEKMGSSYGPEAIYYQGMASNSLGKIDDAVGHFARAAKMRYGWSKTKHPGLQLHYIAGTKFGNGDLKGACEIGETMALPALRGELRIHLLRDLGLFNRDYGTALERRGKKKEAQAVYVKSRDFYADVVKDMEKYSGLNNDWKAQSENDYALMFHYHFDDLESAVKHYRKALEYDKANTDACLNLGRIMMRRGKLEEALRIAQMGKERADLSALIRRIKSQM